MLLGIITKNCAEHSDEKEIFYFHGDHLGSASWITDASSKPIQYIHYAPYGELIDNQRVINYDERYKFTGKERDAESGYDYFGARYYASPFSFWLSVDPLADKYPAISPYAYCTWNPVKYVDPDGMKLRYGEGITTEFQQKLEETIKYMNSKNTSWIIAKIEKSERIVYIEPTTEESKCVTKDNIITIYWNPDVGCITNLGAILSPATILNHEADHALQGIENPTQKRVDINTKNSKYDNLEEKRVITGSEKITAYRHGEIGKGEATRYDHKGQKYETTSPTSTMGVYEIIVDAPQKK